ncbi:MAG: DUF4012 domain-containing protein [bacterium]
MGKDIKLRKIGEDCQAKSSGNKAKMKVANFRFGKKIKLVKIFASEKIKVKKEKIKNRLFVRNVALLPIGAKLNKKARKQKNRKIKKQESKAEGHKFTRIKDVNKKKDWVVLDEKAGENFVLGNLKESPFYSSLPVSESFLCRQAGQEEMIVDEKNNAFFPQVSIIGMPEAGKKEPWNFIKIKNDNQEQLKRDKEYILDDFDTLHDLSKETFNYHEIKKEKYIASPYVVNLGEGKENNEIIKQQNNKTTKQQSEKEELRNKEFKKLRENWKFGNFGIRKLFSKKQENNEIIKQEKKSWAYISRQLLSIKRIEFLNAVKEIFSIKRQVFATAVNFSIIALLLISPIYGMRYYAKARSAKGKVMGAATGALHNLKLGKELLSEAAAGLNLSEQAGNYAFGDDIFEKANMKFDEAKIGFEIAEGALNSINNTVFNIAFKVFNKDEEIESAQALIKAGEKAAEISKLISEGLGNIKIKKLSKEKLEIDELGNQEVVKFEENGGKIFGGNLMDIVNQFNNTAGKALPKIKELKNYLSKIDIEIIPNEYKEEIKNVFEMAAYIEHRLDDCVKYSKTAADILANGSSARYLFIFQNNNEMRATGGFIGSYSLIDIKNGEIVNFETPDQGSYALQGELLSNLKSPNALQLINGRWEFQDSNWWPDFPQSAEFIANIYEKSGGPTVDGIIAINASFMEKLLEVIGDVEMLSYGKVITSDNFVRETQKAVELEYNRKENKPKKIIADLMPRVLEKMFGIFETSQDSSSKKMADMLSVFIGSLRNRDIQIYSTDETLEAEIKSLGWAGEIKNIENRDYLAIIDTNLGGRKTDRVIQQYFQHKTEVLMDGAIIDELTITKKHNGIKGDYFEGVNNVDYLRIYVPRGSVLLEAEGFDPPPADCYEELRENIVRDEYLTEVENREKEDIKTGTITGENFGKTYFANWTQVDPGEEITIRIKYKLPFKFFDSGNVGKYSLYIQKQSGSLDHIITKSLNLPDNLKPVWSYPGAPENGEWVRFDKLDSDRFYGAIFTATF